VVLRTWNTLYFRERLSKTELEYALVNGPTAMDFLFRNGAMLAAKLFPDREYASILEKAMALGEIDFAELQPEQISNDKPCVACDYCGEDASKVNRCSGCKIAIYCGRDCQKGDWKQLLAENLLLESKELCSSILPYLSSHSKEQMERKLISKILGRS